MDNYSEIFGGLELSERIAVYVPSTQNVNEENDNREQVEYIAREFSAMFGGATAQSVRGYWHSETAGLVAEAITVVFSNCTPEQLQTHAQDVKNIAHKIKREMSQEAVSVEISGHLFII